MVNVDGLGDIEQRDAQKSNDAQREERETSEIGKTSDSEDVPSLIVYPVPLGVGIMEVVIGLCMAQGEICAPSRWVG